MGFKSIITKMLRHGPLRAIRTEINRKVDNKLYEFIQPVNENIQALATLIHETGNQLHNTRNQLDHAITQIQDNANLVIRQHQEVVANQALAYYHAWLSFAYPAFAKALATIAGDGHRDLLPHAHLLLMEIAKHYVSGTGIWQLDYEINSFNAPPLPARTHSTPGKANQGRLKILVASGMFPSIEHGGGLRLFDILSQLGKDHDIDLFSVHTPMDAHSRGLLAGSIREIHLVDQESFTQSTLLSWLASLGRAPGHYDVIQCEYPYSVRLIEALRPFGRKIGFTFMECVTKSYVIKLRNSIADRDFANLERLAHQFWEFALEELEAARSTDFQVATTPEDALFIEAVSGIRPEVVPTCLSPSQVIAPIKACQDSGPEGDTVVFLGYFNHFPNIDGVRWYLRHVHQEVKREVPGYRFLVVGAGDTGQLQELCKDDPAVLFTGRVDDITPHIQRGKVCVLPLVSGAGIRGKLNQYSMAGRPSVSTTIGNLGINYPDGEAVMVADTPAAFTAAVVRLLTDSDCNRAMAARAQAFAEANFTWERHLARLVEIYRA